MLNRTVIALIAICLILVPARLFAGSKPSQNPRAIAEQFAPVFLQEITSTATERFDYPTRADFDHDWIGTNDWKNAEIYPLPANVYYSILETETHYYIHYPLFHPRDWKGGPVKTRMWDGFRHFAYIADPSRVFQDMALSHENDLEGVMLVIEKSPAPHVVFAETLAHSKFTKFATADFIRDHLSLPQKIHLLTIDHERPVFAVESKGHGIEDPRGRKPKHVIIYRFTGTAEDPEKRTGNEVGYALISIHDTFWSLSPEQAKTFSVQHRDYSRIKVTAFEDDGTFALQRICANPVGAHIKGRVGAHDFAHFPWAWQAISGKELFGKHFTHDQPYPGAWFFDPARMIKKHFELDHQFSTTYLYHPYIGCSTPQNKTIVAK